jgi:hypothetical protein
MSGSPVETLGALALKGVGEAQTVYTRASVVGRLLTVDNHWHRVSSKNRLTGDELVFMLDGAATLE